MSDTGEVGANEESLYDRILRAAWVKYHEESTTPESFYSTLYLRGKGEEPETRVNSSVLFLALWNAWDYRFQQPGVVRALEYLPGFLRENASNIQSLRNRAILTLEEGDFAVIRDLAAQLDYGLVFNDKFGPRRAQTAWGKLLHFLVPEAILLWDGEYVRNGPLQLGDGPDDFVALQRWGQRLARQLDETNRGATERLSTDHRRMTNGHYDEPVTKIFDEAMYDAEAIEHAIDAIGGPYDPTPPK